MLGYAARKYHDTQKGYPSKYEAELVAFVVPGVVAARPILQAFGWKVIEKGLPVELADIENQDYAMKVCWLTLTLILIQTQPNKHTLTLPNPNLRR